MDGAPQLRRVAPFPRENKFDYFLIVACRSLWEDGDVDIQQLWLTPGLLHPRTGLLGIVRPVLLQSDTGTPGPSRTKLPALLSQGVARVLCHPLQSGQTPIPTVTLPSSVQCTQKRGRSCRGWPREPSPLGANPSHSGSVPEVTSPSEEQQGRKESMLGPAGYLLGSVKSGQSGEQDACLTSDHWPKNQGQSMLALKNVSFLATK